MNSDKLKNLIFVSQITNDRKLIVKQTLEWLRAQCKLIRQRLQLTIILPTFRDSLRDRAHTAASFHAARSVKLRFIPSRIQYLIRLISQTVL